MPSGDSVTPSWSIPMAIWWTCLPRCKLDCMDIAQLVANRLAEIEGVVAVVLGGSRARGAASPDSDIDFGIYYDPDRRPALDALRALAKELDDRHADDLVTD